MPVNIQDHWEYTLREWTNDPFTRLVNAMPETLGVIFDVGANAGGWTEVMHRKYPNAEFHCFEPVPYNYEGLIKNVPYAKHYNYGIYYGKTDSAIQCRGDGNIGAFFVEHIIAGNPIVTVEGRMVLKTLEEVGVAPDLVKMDIEGAEENVIMYSDLLRNTPWIIVEWHPDSSFEELRKQFLPNHEVVVNLENKQYLLHANINRDTNLTPSRTTKSVRKPKKADGETSGVVSRNKRKRAD